MYWFLFELVVIYDVNLSLKHVCLFSFNEYCGCNDLNRLFTNKPSCNVLLPHYSRQGMALSSVEELEINENTRMLGKKCWFAARFMMHHIGTMINIKIQLSTRRNT